MFQSARRAFHAAMFARQIRASHSLIGGVFVELTGREFIGDSEAP
jgi:hypothetical protein